MKVHKTPLFLNNRNDSQDARLLWTNRPGNSGAPGTWFYRKEYKAWLRVEGLVAFIAEPYAIVGHDGPRAQGGARIYRVPEHKKFSREVFALSDSGTKANKEDLIEMCIENLQYYGEHHGAAE